MNAPDWQGFVCDQGILAEPTADGGRLVLWVPAERDPSFQYWERVANVARGEITITEGLCTTAATSIRARQRVRGVVGRLWDRLRPPRGSRAFLLPNGKSALQCKDRQSDLLLVWPEDKTTVLELDQLKSKWPEAKRFEKLGHGLFLVAGVGAQASRREAARQPLQPPGTDSPQEHAEALLAAARQAGDRNKEATALTDLGVIALSKGKAQDSMTLLEKALEITRKLPDPARESDVMGNLGMTLLALGQPLKARSAFEQTLAHARATGDRFAEKAALERLGISFWRLRDFNGALGLFDQALELARQVGDRHQQANLLWHQGIQHAELGQRQLAIEKAEESIALFRLMGRPQAASYGAYLQKYRMGLSEDSPGPTARGAVDRSPEAYLGGALVASVMAGGSATEAAHAKPATGPGLLRMAMSATKAMAGFVGSGFKTAPAETQRLRLQTCAACEHHTGVRCKICGCFTNVKSRMLHEDCPIGKWPA